MMAALPRRVPRKEETALPVRIRVAAPASGFGEQLAVMAAWLNASFGPGRWSAAPAGLAGIANDAIALYFADSADARAFIDRFCCGYRNLADASPGIAPAVQRRGPRRTR